jgi:hypothetical protein
MKHIIVPRQNETHGEFSPADRGKVKTLHSGCEISGLRTLFGDTNPLYAEISPECIWDSLLSWWSAE